MATAQPKRRNTAEPSVRKTVKSTIVVDVDLHARWSAAASLRGMDRSAYAVEVLTDALKGFFIIDRRKSSGKADLSNEVDREDAA